MNDFRASHEKAIASMGANDLASYEIADAPINALDLGNGNLGPRFEILRTAGYQVLGIDRLNDAKRSWRDYAYRAARWLFS